MIDPVTGAWIALIALSAGLYGGLMGVGGGAILVPALHLLFGVPLHEAIPFSLCTAVLISASATFSINRKGGAHFPTVRAILAGSVPGAVLGLSLGRVLSGQALRTCFAAFLLWAVYDGFRAKPSEEADVHRWEPVSPRKGRTGVIGLLMGLASGLIGIGGGLISTPLQRRWLDVPVKAAMANSTYAIVGTTLAGVVSAAFYRHRGGEALLPWTLLAWGALPVMAGGYLGGHLHHRLHSKWLLFLFSGLLGFMAFKMLTAGS
jgi:hypothetical protein